MIYTGENTKEISFPLGGIGSGSIGIDGGGRFFDWEIFNRPNKGSRNGYSHIAVRAKTKNGTLARVLSGDIQKEFSGQYKKRDFSGFGFGADIYTMCGFPHFKNLTFNGEFPIAKLTFSDADFPAEITMTAFNPFIPLDDKNSSIPAAFFEIEIKNVSDEDIEYQTALSLASPFEKSKHEMHREGGISAIQIKNTEKNTDEIGYGDMSAAASGGEVYCQNYWYRGGWKDSIVTFWNEFCSGEDLPPRDYESVHEQGFDTCTVCVKTDIARGESEKVRFILSWNFPNCYNYWKENGDRTPWRNYYAELFSDSLDSAFYSMKNFDSLYERTLDFKNRLFSSSIDPVFIDAVSSTMSVLKSPTVMRLEDGSFYGWEGVHEIQGSCEGTCQHVWNYAYALCFLFPKLERSIRDLEFKYSLDPDGKMRFRMGLPVGKNKDGFRACLDGQMGCILKSYREWKISGDGKWLAKNWVSIKKTFEYAQSTDNPDEWDRDRDGILEGRQHNTLDAELFGPSSWLEGMYLAAAKAMSEMARFFGEDPKPYDELFKNGYEWSKENLFNGEYFIQKVDLKDREKIAHFNAEDTYWNGETGEIKYQIGEGSEIDQLLGQWHADILGLGDIFDHDQLDTALKSMMKNNFKESVRGFTNPWRVFSVNDESGTVMCDYPSGSYKPKIPVPYCEETMHGFEYQFAGLLASRGKINDAKRVVKAVRDKYDGKKRNPWNEIECGSNYARSMASFALLNILSGFEFDMPNNYIGFNPKTDSDNFSFFWSIETGWGSFIKNGKKIILEIAEGFLELERLGIKFAQGVKRIVFDGKDEDFEFSDGVIAFPKVRAEKKIEIEI